jgi:hypothetical protein
MLHKVVTENINNVCVSSLSDLNSDTYSFKNVPDDLLALISVFLSTKEKAFLARLRIDMPTVRFFRAQISINQLFYLLANNDIKNKNTLALTAKPIISNVFKNLIAAIYHLSVPNEDEINSILEKKINPILLMIDFVLAKDPSIAFQPINFVDHLGHELSCSILEYAYASKYPVVQHLIYEHAKCAPSGVILAEKLLLGIDRKCIEYDLTLMMSNKLIFPLTPTPTLIKQFRSKTQFTLYLWGSLNGEWQLNELNFEDQALFPGHIFPSVFNSTIVTCSLELTLEMQAVLKKHHSPIHFDIQEYLRATKSFIQKFPAMQVVQHAQWSACETESKKIGKTQKKFPTWLALLWCSDATFDAMFAVNKVILHLIHLDLEYSGEPFYGKDLGELYSIYKGKNRAQGRIYTQTFMNGAAARRLAPLDLAAMTAVSAVTPINSEEFKRCFSP